MLDKIDRGRWRYCGKIAPSLQALADAVNLTTTSLLETPETARRRGYSPPGALALLDGEKVGLELRRSSWIRPSITAAIGTVGSRDEADADGGSARLLADGGEYLFYCYGCRWLIMKRYDDFVSKRLVNKCT